jgi:transposase
VRVSPDDNTLANADCVFGSIAWLGRIDVGLLDPRPYGSDTSVHQPRRISKVGNRQLRATLYMPALVAVQHDPNVKAFYNKLIAAGKKPMQVVVAVMRKLLHPIWGML